MENINLKSTQMNRLKQQSKRLVAPGQERVVKKINAIHLLKVKLYCRSMFLNYIRGWILYYLYTYFIHLVRSSPSAAVTHIWVVDKYILASQFTVNCTVLVCLIILVCSKLHLKPP